MMRQSGEETATKAYEPEGPSLWAPRFATIGLLGLGLILAYTFSAIDLKDGTSLSITEANTKITFQGDGWVMTATWFGAILAMIAAVVFPFSERFAQSLAVTFGSILGLAFPYFVWHKLETIDEDARGVGAGLELAAICFILAAILPWLNVLVFNRTTPVFGRDWSKWLFLLPAVVWILLLTVFPLAYAITTSRYVFRNGKISRFVEWENYQRLFQRDFVFNPISRAIVFALVLGAIYLAIRLLIQFLQNRTITEADIRSSLSLLPIILVPVAVVFSLSGFNAIYIAFGNPKWVTSLLDLVGQKSLVDETHVGILRDPVDAAFAITIVFVVIAVAIEMFLGFGLALLMNRELKGRGVLRAILTLPIFAAPVGIGYLGRTIFYEGGGPVNSLFDAFGVTPKPWLSDPFWSKISTIIADVWQWTPFVFVIALAGLQSLPQEILEASEVDGSSWWQSFRSITLPMMAPILWLIVLLRTIDAFKVFDIAQSMTVGGPGRATEYYSMFNYRTARKFFNYGDAAAQAFLLLFVVSVLITVLWSRISHIYEEDEGVPA
jgi:multiple sugar transport system permease protein